MQVQFKANSSKSNAKRFLVNTAKLSAEVVDQYLAQEDGKWGCYLNEQGAPVELSTLAVALLEAGQNATTEPTVPAEQPVAQADAEQVAEHAVAMLPEAQADAAAEQPATPEVQAEPEAPAPGAANTFGGFAFAQLTADSNKPAQAPAAPAQPDRAVVDEFIRTSTCPKCGTTEVYIGHSEGGLVVEDENVGGCHRCDWSYDLRGAKPAAGTGIKIEKDRPMQNGIKRPSAGGLCRAVWDALDEFRAANGGAIMTAAQVKELAGTKGWNVNNASIEYYAWRKYNGIKGRQATAPVAAPAPTEGNQQ